MKQAILWLAKYIAWCILEGVSYTARNPWSVAWLLIGLLLFWIARSVSISIITN